MDALKPSNGETYRGRLIFEIPIPNQIDSRGDAQWELFFAFRKLAEAYRTGKIDVADDLWIIAKKYGIKVDDEYETGS